MSRDPAVLQDLSLFVEVARLRSFSRAATLLGVSTATVSRRIAALEKDCGTLLFNRSTRVVAMTDAGTGLLERCAPLVDAAHEARDSLRSRSGCMTGTLRISAPVEFGAFILSPVVAEFSRLHPDVLFQVDLSSRHVDLLQDQFDVAVRIGPVRNEGLVSRRIATLEQGLFAAPAYIRRRGNPEHPRDLSHHDCLFISKPSPDTWWRLSRGRATVDAAVHSRFCCNNQTFSRMLCEQGLGVAVLDRGLVEQSVSAKRLVRVLSEWFPPRLAVYAVSTSRLRSAVLNTFLDFTSQRLADVNSVALSASTSNGARS